ncbi:MAG: hypothetical protein CVU64_10070 [Deltaproteobacteria bacterium HGW-Deltaproteobacteria-21]|nr:MAG: hypothetical protein CVU64_10070 [Deltaproteobacteria bacterium HGW-Deltaproteobacteria-21]
MDSGTTYAAKKKKGNASRNAATKILRYLRNRIQRDRIIHFSNSEEYACLWSREVNSRAFSAKAQAIYPIFLIKASILMTA